MLLTIHNLPSSTRYVDVKTMLQDKCGLEEFILDNLVSEGATKKVTVGLADEGDAGILARKINGLFINGLQLYIEDKRKKKDSDQPYRSSASRVQDREPISPRRTMVESMPSSVNNAQRMNYNTSGRYRPTPVIPVDQNMSYMGYSGGGPRMAMSPVEARPPAPARRERDFTGFQGEGGVTSGWPREQARVAPRPREQPLDAPRLREQDRDAGRPRDQSRDAGRPREQGRDAPRPRIPAHDSVRARDMNCRPSPDRPAEVFNRPTRWNEPKQRDVPPRREPSSPRQPWTIREPNRAPRPLTPPPLPERAGPRGREQFSPRRSPPERRRMEPQWDPRQPSWDEDRDPQLREQRWSGEPEPRWEPEPDRDWQPEPDRARDRPYHIMEDAGDRRFNRHSGEHDFPSGPARDYPRPERFELDSRRFDEGYPHHNEPNSHGRHREQPDDRERRPRRDADWNAGNERRDKNRAANSLSRDEQPWPEPSLREDRQRPTHLIRHDNREPKSSGSNFRNDNDWYEDRRPNPSKRVLSDQQRGAQEWSQIASDYPPFKKTKGDIEKRFVEPRRNNFEPKDNENHRRMPAQKAPEGPQRVPQTLSSLLDGNQMPEKVTRNKDQTRRGQATAKLAKEVIFAHGKPTQVPSVINGIMKELKQCIRSRIDAILGKELVGGYEEIIGRYRLKHPARNDKELYLCMKDEVSRRLALTGGMK